MAGIDLRKPDDAALFFRHASISCQEAFAQMHAMPPGKIRAWREGWPDDSAQGAIYIHVKRSRVCARLQNGDDQYYRADLLDARATDWRWGSQ